MKKIIALLLIVVSLLALAACKAPADDLAPFKAALKDSAPVGATINSKLEINGTVLNGEYNVLYNDGVATVVYTNEILNAFPAEGALPAEKTEVPGNATVDAEGTVTAGSIGQNFAALAAHKITLDADKMTYSISGGILVATLSAADGAALTTVPATTDVTLNITTFDGKLTGISVSYGTDAGVVSIVCVYVY